MVKIRLSRLGKTHRPYYRVIAVDSRKKRDGAFLDNLGTYDPIRHEILSLNLDRIAHWISQGAQCSSTVARLVKKHTKGTNAQKSA